MRGSKTGLQIVSTGDGSHTLYHEGLAQHYHSTFGAMQESEHVFIETGFRYAAQKFERGKIPFGGGLHILEIGFGTGLNALLTQAEAEKLGIMVYYTAIEAFPLDENQWQSLNYPHLFGSVDFTALFSKLHLAPWNAVEIISPHFTLHKIHTTLEMFVPAEKYNLVFFDAFGPEAQPELWSKEVFRVLSHAIESGGILVTYSVKGDVVRALKSVGFVTEKLPGPPGKRHILRAAKP